MKKLLFSLGVFGLLSLALTSLSYALTGSKTFTLSASVPAATGIAINASKVDSASNQFSAVAGTALTFNPLIFNSVNGVYLPDHYFAIDIGASGGAGTPDATVTYTEGANPNNPGHGLGWKASATFVKVQGTTETQLAAHGPKKLLKSVNGETISFVEVVGGFLRIYVGINSGDVSTPATGEPFTNGDKSGTYDGTLFISATVN